MIINQSTIACNFITNNIRNKYPNSKASLYSGAFVV